MLCEVAGCFINRDVHLTDEDKTDKEEKDKDSCTVYGTVDCCLSVEDDLLYNTQLLTEMKTNGERGLQHIPHVSPPNTKTTPHSSYSEKGGEKM